jgi:dTDP-4-dehydrorhamnose reductase
VLIGVSSVFMDSTALTTASVARILVVGSGGRLGAALVRQYRETFDVTGFNHAQLDLNNLDEIRAKLGGLDFDILINAAALTNVDLCEKEPEQAFQINAEAPRVLAEICRSKNAKLIHFSTDYVFDGENREPYSEEDLARPISVYGESKRAGEEHVLAADDGHLVVRVSWVFGPDRPSFVDGMIARARENAKIDAVADKFSTPTYTRDVAQMLLRVLSVAGVADPGSATMERHSQEAGVNEPGYSGILHFANAGGCSWQEYAQHAIDCCHQFGIPLKARKVAPANLGEMKNFIARRPVYTVLSTAKYASLAGAAPRPWRDAVAEYVREFVSR